MIICFNKMRVRFDCVISCILIAVCDVNIFTTKDIRLTRLSPKTKDYSVVDNNAGIKSRNQANLFK